MQRKRDNSIIEFPDSTKNNKKKKKKKKDRVEFSLFGHLISRNVYKITAYYWTINVRE